MQEKNPLKVAAIVVFVVLVMFLITTIFNSVKKVNTDNSNQLTDNLEQTIVVSVIDENSNTKSYSVAYQEGISALESLKQLQREDISFTFTYSEYDFGAFVTGINGYWPDTKVSFWEFKVNNESAQVGVSDYIVKPTDTLDFVVTKIDPNL